MNLTQLSLDIGLKDYATFSSYCKNNNEMPYACIENMAQNQGEQFVYLWGGHGFGKTHLLQAACNLASEKDISSVYISFENLVSENTQSKNIDILSGLDKIDLVCLDNINMIEKAPYLEESIFILFNQIRDNNKKLLVAADKTPAALELKLSDLKSRLTWGVTYQLHSLLDGDKLKVLQTRAISKGFELDDVVGKFLLRRCSRNMADLFAVLECLDKESLVKQHKITIPFVKQILNI